MRTITMPLKVFLTPCFDEEEEEDDEDKVNIQKDQDCKDTDFSGYGEQSSGFKEQIISLTFDKNLRLNDDDPSDIDIDMDGTSEPFHSHSEYRKEEFDD